jgi:hypothetical protein
LKKVVRWLNEEHGSTATDFYDKLEKWQARKKYIDAQEEEASNSAHEFEEATVSVSPEKKKTTPKKGKAEKKVEKEAKEEIEEQEEKEEVNGKHEKKGKKDKQEKDEKKAKKLEAKEEKKGKPGKEEKKGKKVEEKKGESKNGTSGSSSLHVTPETKKSKKKAGYLCCESPETKFSRES